MKKLQRTVKQILKAFCEFEKSCFIAQKEKENYF